MSPLAFAAQKATIFHDVATVFKEADFDSEIVGEVHGGEVYDISNNKTGPFYKIRLKNGKLGFIADNEVRIGVTKEKKIAEKKVDPKSLNKVEKQEIKKAFVYRRYRGPKLEAVNFTENTMGKTASEVLSFVGLNVAGMNTMFDGEIFTDANLLLYTGAPSYYKKATSNSASGYILLANFLMETAIPQSKWYMLFYGFGGSLRMSHFDVTLNENSKLVSYALDDINIGAVVNGGITFQTGASAIRFDLKYYVEKTYYAAFGLSWGLQF